MRPVMFVWDGECMQPAPRFVPLCNKQFVVGEEYPFEVVQHRSMASHNQYFAALNEAWHNLGEQWNGRFPTSDHLRYWALIQTGFGVETDHVFETAKDAKASARAIRQVDAYSAIVVSGNVVKVTRAKSQSRASMRKEEFEASKTAVLDLIATMARTTRPQLMKHAGKVA
jgi:hypothetical protein